MPVPTVCKLTPALGPFDVIVAGAGVVGLWSAIELARAGLSVALVDPKGPGREASGGILGALLPHMPSGWNDKKQFQFEALQALPRQMRWLEERTGIAIGYRRCGRISPIRRPGFLRQTKAHIKNHRTVWGTGPGAPRYRHLAADDDPDWFDPVHAPLGLANETLTARLRPRAYCQALAAALPSSVTCYFGRRLMAFDPHAKLARLDKGELLRAGHLVIAAGYDSFALLQPYVGEPLGGGVAGEVALLGLDPSVSLAPNAPVIFDDGIYIVVHDANKGLVAVGSTASPLDFAQLSKKPPYRRSLAQVIEKARQLCPPLRQATVREIWQGVRPRCFAKDPLIGQVPGQPVFVATGGFKITLGIAQAMARAVADRLLQVSHPLPLPASFEMDYHLKHMALRRQDASTEGMT